MLDDKEPGKKLDKKPSKDICSDSENDSDDDCTKEEQVYKAKWKIEKWRFEHSN